MLLGTCLGISEDDIAYTTHDLGLLSYWSSLLSLLLPINYLFSCQWAVRALVTLTRILVVKGYDGSLPLFPSLLMITPLPLSFGSLKSELGSNCICRTSIYCFRAFVLLSIPRQSCKGPPRARCKSCDETSCHRRNPALWKRQSVYPR